MTKYETTSIVVSILLVGLVIYFNTKQYNNHKEMINILNKINENGKK